MNIFKELSVKELAVGGVVILLLFVLSNPFDLYMLSMAEMLTLALLVAAFLAFATLLWKERGVIDEREAAHQALVGRIAYIAGATVLVVVIVFQTFTHTLDMTLVFALGVMVFAKIIGSAYVRTRY